MNTTAKYMTLKEHQHYKELAAKYGETVFMASVSLPSFAPPSKVKASKKQEQRTKGVVRRKSP